MKILGEFDEIHGPAGRPLTEYVDENIPALWNTVPETILNVQNTGTEYTGEVEDWGPDASIDGYPANKLLWFRPHVPNNASPGISISGLPLIPFVNEDGSPVAAGQLSPDKNYLLRITALPSAEILLGPVGLTGAVGPIGPVGPSGVPAVSVEDYRGVGGDSTDTGTLLNAIAAAKAAGGMRLYLPARFYTIEQTLLIDENHIWLTGQGSGHIEATTEQVPRTKILWNGSVGGTMVRINSPAGHSRKIGNGLRSLQLDGNLFRAARGLVLESVVWGIYYDLMVRSCSESQIRTETVNYALINPVGDTQRNLFEQVFAMTVGDNTPIYINNTALGWHLTGGSTVNPGNTSGNYFIACVSKTSKGIGWKLENCDDNFFFGCQGQPAYDNAQYAIEFGSQDQDSMWGAQPLGPQTARFNMLYGCGFDRIHCRSSQTGGKSSHGNLFFGYARANAFSLPEIEAPAGGSLPATIYYWDALGNTRQQTVGMEEAIPDSPVPTPGLTQLYVDTVAGGVKALSSAGRTSQFLDAAPGAFPNRDQSPAIYSRFTDGIGTPDVQVGAPSVVFSDNFASGLGSWANNGVAPVFMAAPWGSGQSIQCVVNSAAAQPSSYLSRSISLGLGRVIEFDFWLPQVSGLTAIGGSVVQFFQLRSTAGYYTFGVGCYPTYVRFFLNVFETPNATLHSLVSEQHPAANTKYHVKFEAHRGFSTAVPGRIMISIDGKAAISSPWSVPDHGQTAVATLYFGAISSNTGAPFTVYHGNLVASQMSVDSLATRSTGPVGGVNFVGGWATGAATLGNYANDAAAAGGGVAVGGFYRNGSILMVRVA